MLELLALPCTLHRPAPGNTHVVRCITVAFQHQRQEREVEEACPCSNDPGFPLSVPKPGTGHLKASYSPHCFHNTRRTPGGRETECSHMAASPLVQNKSFFKCLNILSVGGSETFRLSSGRGGLFIENHARWLAQRRALCHSESIGALGFFSPSNSRPLPLPWVLVGQAVTFSESWSFPKL